MCAATVTLSYRFQPRVGTALRMLKQHLFHYQGHIGAYLVLGGVDITGPNLYTVHAHGSTDKLPYVSMGSGSLAAMATFEDRFRPNMDVSVKTFKFGISRKSVLSCFSTILVIQSVYHTHTHLISLVFP